MKKIEVIKANGDRVVFDEQKLIHSLTRAGASLIVANEIAADIREALYDGVKTKEIYKKAFSELKKYSRPTAARYKLKRAIMELGDTGYPFEKFVSALLSAEGYATRVGVIVQGHCVKHEVDVVAENDHHHYMCECKFHNSQGRYCNVKIPLYIHARFKDVERAWRKQKGHKTKFHQGWIFTNTRFTLDAIQYGECMGLKLVSWDYPQNDGIKDRINRTGIHPVTCLTSLIRREKKVLIEQGKILCLDLYKEPGLLENLGIKGSRLRKVLTEAADLCKNLPDALHLSP